MAFVSVRGYVLSVDLGSSGCSAVLVGPDGGWSPLRFDGGGVGLDPAVYAQPNGSWLVGPRAWQARDEDPARFVASPVTVLGHDRVGLGGVVTTGVDLVAVLLAEVARQARARLGGAEVAEVRLTVPAGWGPRWRTGLREAAARAGLGQPVLVDTPVAAAAHLLADGVLLMVGAYVLVCDWGTGMRASVLRRTRYGFEVLSTIEADAGATAVDTGLAAHLAATVGPAAAVVWDTLTWRQVTRTGREALDNAAAVTLPTPTGAPAVLAWPLLRETAAPVIAAAAAAVRQAIAAADLTSGQLAGVFCVGGMAESPVMVALLGQACGLEFTPVAQPSRAAVRGAARVVGPSIEDLANRAEQEDPGPGVHKALLGAVPVAASLALAAHFVSSGTLHRTEAGLGYDPHAYLLANFGELAMAAVFGLVACLTYAVVLAAAMPTTDPLEATAGGAGDGQRMGAGLVAACGLGLAVAGLYAVLASALLQWVDTPFLEWALLPLLPITTVVAVTAVMTARWGRTPRGGWHTFLDFPVGSVCVAAVGMVALQVGLTIDTPGSAAVAGLFVRAGGMGIGIGTAMALTRRWRHRIWLALPLGIIGLGIAGPFTTGVLAVVYTAAATVWWIRRAWRLATRPRGSLPLPA